MAATTGFRIELDTAELQLLIGELTDRIAAVGGPERAKAIIGSPVDMSLIRSMYRFEMDGKGTIRVLPTPVFDRILQQLWVGRA